VLLVPHCQAASLSRSVSVSVSLLAAASLYLLFPSLSRSLLLFIMVFLSVACLETSQAAKPLEPLLSP
jgi:hypothetical protein